MQAYTRADENSMSVEPLLTSDSNFEPSSDSPLLYSGITLFGNDNDITGYQRSIPPTIGAREYKNYDELHPPVVSSPRNRAYGVGNSPCLVTWSQVPTAAYYELQYSTNQDFPTESTVIVDNILGENTSINLTPLTKYFLRVRAKNETLISNLVCKIEFLHSWKYICTGYNRT